MLAEPTLPQKAQALSLNENPSFRSNKGVALFAIQDYVPQEERRIASEVFRTSLSVHVL